MVKRKKKVFFCSISKNSLKKIFEQKKNSQQTVGGSVP